MDSISVRRWQETLRRPSFWAVIVLLVAIGLAHYLTPQVRLVFSPFQASLSRHTIERIAFLLPIAIAAAAFRQRGGLIVLVAALLLMLPRIIWISPLPADALAETAVTTVVGCLLVRVIEAQAREKELRQRIADENAHLYKSMRFYAQQIARAQEEERQRIARDLHDDTIQTLILLSRRLEALATGADPLPPTARERLQSLQELNAGAIGRIRRFIQDLRPPTLDHLGLVAALDGLVDRLTEETGIQAAVQVAGEARRLDPNVELDLFRIAQEALNNVRRHARASQATVGLTFATGKVQLTVEDDGCGFEVPRKLDPSDLIASGRLGLVGMQERAQSLGGHLDVRSTPGHGTQIHVQVPI